MKQIDGFPSIASYIRHLILKNKTKHEIIAALMLHGMSRERAVANYARVLKYMQQKTERL